MYLILCFTTNEFIYYAVLLKLIKLTYLVYFKIFYTENHVKLLICSLTEVSNLLHFKIGIILPAQYIMAFGFTAAQRYNYQ